MEAQHKLYDSLEEMLAPETLSELLSMPVSSVEVRPMTDHYGHSKLYYVDTDAGRFVFKRMSMEHDYLMYTSNDQRCRAVRLWQYGFLDELQPLIEHKIIACGQDGNGWGMLMYTLGDGLFEGEENAMSSRLVLEFLDHLAKLHASFWNDPRLEDPRTGLHDIKARLNLFSLKLAQKQNGDQRGVISTWVREGWKILETMLESDLFQQLSNLS